MFLGKVNSASVRLGEPSGVNWERTPQGLLKAISTALVHKQVDQNAGKVSRWSIL